MAKRTCSIEGCGNLHRARGWCSTHYNRWRDNGTTDDIFPTLAGRFWAKVDVRGENECWPWLASLVTNGYAAIRVDGRRLMAHRVAYELMVGPIPEGLQLDHLCRVRHCVNPAHLEPVTCRENILRGTAPSAENAAKTHCVNGHPFDDKNTHVTAVGGRSCLMCRRARSIRYYHAAHNALAPQPEGTST